MNEQSEPPHPPPQHGVEKSRSDSSLLKKVALCFVHSWHVNLTQLTPTPSSTIQTHALTHRKKPGVKIIAQGVDMPRHMRPFPTCWNRSVSGPQNGKIDQTWGTTNTCKSNRFDLDLQPWVDQSLYYDIFRTQYVLCTFRLFCAKVTKRCHRYFIK